MSAENDRAAAEPTDAAATVVLPHDTTAPTLARDFVNAHSADLPADLVEDARLLATEIVTNAVRYGRADITLTIRFDPPCLGVAVADTGSTLPALPGERPSDLQPSGRGLLIVSALADAWGVTPNTGAPGKSVWFELRPADRKA